MAEPIPAGLLIAPDALAATSTQFGVEMAAIPTDAVAYVLALALLGGLSPALGRIKRSNCHRRALMAGVAQDLVASAVAGLLTFFVTEAASIAWPAQAALILGAGWGGAKVMHRALDGWLDRVLPPSPYDGPERRHNPDKRHPPMGGRRTTDYLDMDADEE